MKKMVIKLQNIINEILEICREQADNMAVLDLQMRILKVISKGLDEPKEKIKRSECPYGGIDCAWCTEDCE